MSLPIFSEHADVSGYQKLHGISKQEAARDLRYQFFERARTAMKAEVVATAHQADDNAETVLMNALRGAGVRGLSGIPIHRQEGSIIRPLLFARRSEIEKYSNEAGVRFREDSSNRLTDSTRNSFRHLLLPALSMELHADVVQSLNRVADSMRSLSDEIGSALEKTLKEVVSEGGGNTVVAIPALRALPLYLQEETALHVFRRLAIEPSVSKVLLLLGLCDQPTGRTLHLSGNWHALRDRDQLVIHPAEAGAAFEHEIQVGREYSVQGFRFASDTLESVPHRFPLSPETEVVDGGLLGKHLVLRSWRDGDSFVPLGMKESKKLSDFFVNQKVSRRQKHQTPILESDGTIVWVCGLRLDNRFRVTPTTRSAVRLRYSPIAQ